MSAALHELLRQYGVIHRCIIAVQRPQPRPKINDAGKQVTEDREEKVENYQSHGEPPRKVGKNVPARA